MADSNVSVDTSVSADTSSEISKDTITEPTLETEATPEVTPEATPEATPEPTPEAGKEARPTPSPKQNTLQKALEAKQFPSVAKMLEWLRKLLEKKQMEPTQVHIYLTDKFEELEKLDPKKLLGPKWQERAKEFLDGVKDAIKKDPSKASNLLMNTIALAEQTLDEIGKETANVTHANAGNQLGATILGAGTAVVMHGRLHEWQDGASIERVKDDAQGHLTKGHNVNAENKAEANANPDADALDNAPDQKHDATNTTTPTPTPTPRPSK